MNIEEVRQLIEKDESRVLEPKNKSVGLPEPEYGTDGTFVWITFKRPNSVTNSVTNSDTNSNTNSNTNSDTNLVTDLVTIDSKSMSDRQKEVLRYCMVARSSREILEHIGVTYHNKNIEKFINSLVEVGFLERTIPETPNSPKQKYITNRSRKNA